MSRVLYRLGLWCARHAKYVLAAWIAIVIGLGVLVAVIGTDNNDNLTVPGSGSTRATEILDNYLPKQANGTNPVVLEAASGTLSDEANSKVVEATVTSLKAAPGVTKAVSPLSEQGASQLSSDGTIGYISLTLSIAPEDLDEDAANAIIDAADPASDAGMTVAFGGYLGQEVSTASTEVSELIGVIAAVIILMLAFGTAVAMMMPLATAIVGLVTGLSLIGVLGHVVEIPSIAPTLGTMIGLGVGIDYSLFIVTRYRTRMAEGMTVREAIARSCATSGSAVAFAGGTVVIALCSLVLARIPIVTALGYSAAIVVAVAVMAAITLLPALLGVVGHRIEKLKLPRHEVKHEHDHPEGWLRWAEGVAKRPWPALIAAVIILVLLGIPITGMRLGQQDNGQLPTSTTTRQAYDLLQKGFGPGVNGPFLIAVKLDPAASNDQQQLDQFNDQQQQQTEAADVGLAPPPSAAQQQQAEQQQQFLESPASDPRLTKLSDDIAGDPGVVSISLPSVSSDGVAAVYQVIPTTAPSAETTEHTVVRLRDKTIPPAETNGLQAFVGGSTAGYIDLADQISDRLVQVIAIVVALSFLLLLLAFRSVLVPVTSALMNLLSVLAAYGVLVAVFEDGVGLSLIGLDHEVPIVSFVPLLMFAVLFGLSMDYQVFLVSRIGEIWRETGDNRKAVIFGLASSARVITSAALIMVFVFGSFILNGNPTVKQFGIGLSVAIAVDATIVRCLLVPATMILLGKANWWLPGWLDRILPRVGLETEDSLPAPEYEAGREPGARLVPSPDPQRFSGVEPGAESAPEPEPAESGPGPEPPDSDPDPGPEPAAGGEDSSAAS